MFDGNFTTADTCFVVALIVSQRTIDVETSPCVRMKARSAVISNCVRG